LSIIIASKAYESDLIRQLHSGKEHIVLPETPEQFDTMADLLTVTKVSVPKAFVYRYFKARLRILDEQKKCRNKSFIFHFKTIFLILVLKSFLKNDYINLDKYYAELKQIKCPALILWGRQDQVCDLCKIFNYFYCI
jgi:pimeloyl-ACP methyl ester carboxylesterase